MGRFTPPDCLFHHIQAQFTYRPTALGSLFNRPLAPGFDLRYLGPLSPIPDQEHAQRCDDKTDGHPYGDTGIQAVSGCDVQQVEYGVIQQVGNPGCPQMSVLR
jgi:hypothetical protein